LVISLNRFSGQDTIAELSKIMEAVGTFVTLITKSIQNALTKVTPTALTKVTPTAGNVCGRWAT
jgi:hypothetical protein